MAKKEIQIYKISGNYVKRFQKFQFTKYARALNEKDALEKVLSVITSVGLLRRKIKITEIKTVEIDECDDLFIRSLSQIE
ncbi:MAG: 50S ribosomal protein L18Ae [Promethearchaeota archaeon]